MRFAEILLSDIKMRENDFLRRGGVIDSIKSASTTGIWGTGIAAQLVYTNLCRMGVKISFFADNDKNRWNTKYNGIEVLSSNRVDKDSLIIICANVKYGIHEQLKRMGINNYIYIDPAYFYYTQASNAVQIIEQNADKIEHVCTMLKDDRSKCVYRNVLMHRAVYDLEAIWEVYDERQYFGNYIVNRVTGNFVDCGAFEGDTLCRFLKQIGNDEYRYFAFEADTNNFVKLQKYCTDNGLSKVSCYNLGVWNQKEELFFNIGESIVSGTLIGECTDYKKEKVMVDSIDNVMNGEKIDFISMDIEGSEIKALEGARKSIQKWKPTLAISAYHQLEHLWEVPLLIKEIYGGYDIYFAHHCWNMDDTVCYAKER